MTRERRNLAERLARASVSRVHGGVLFRSSNGITFLGDTQGNHGLLSLQISETDGISRLTAATTTGSIEVASGTKDEMDAFCERASSLMRSDWPMAMAMSFGLIGLLVGVLISGTAMFAMNEQKIDGPIQSLAAAPASAPGPNLRSVPAIHVAQAPVPLPAATNTAVPKTVPLSAPTLPTSLEVISPKADGDKPSFQTLIQQLMETNPSRGKLVVETIETMGAFVRNGQEIPEELVERLPVEILQRMLADARDAGVTDIRIRPKVISGTPLAGRPPMPLQLPPSADVSNPRKELPSTVGGSLSTQGQRPLVWGGPNGESIPRDVNGIPTVPEPASRAALPESIQLPGLGGGTLNSTTELRSFSLPTE